MEDFQLAASQTQLAKFASSMEVFRFQPKNILRVIHSVQESCHVLYHCLH